jgi:uncharacterized membrane protein
MEDTVNTHSGNLSRGERIGSVVLAAGLTLLMTRRGSPLLRLLGGTIAASLFGRAVAGHCGMKAAITGESGLRQGLTEQWQRTAGVGRRLARREGGFTGRAGIQRVEETIDVERPVGTVYNQWTQFETFPQFMAGVKEVQQIDDTHVHWRAEVWGKEVEWDAEITEQEPDKRISWKSVNGAHNAGTVRFEPLDTNRTRVRLVMAYEPAGPVENLGDALGLFKQQVKSSVREFKRFIETRGQETGAWRGQVDDSLAH